MEQRSELQQAALAAGSNTPVLGITGTGGTGKSSLTDEIILRLRLDSGNSIRIAVLAIDPIRRKTGGALLGDRIRMNAIYHDTVFMRSLATRSAATEIPEYLPDVINAVKVCGYDLIIVETPGIGQGDAGIVPLVDIPLYVMTPEFGASSQLEKIDMLDFAEAVAINKFDRKGAEDARRGVAKQLQRNREQFSLSPDEMPVYGTIAANYNDSGVTALYQGLLPLLRGKGLPEFESVLPPVTAQTSTGHAVIVPPPRQGYLGEIAMTVRQYHQHAQEQACLARANGFTFVETYLARGVHIDDFAPNLSFFFSNGMDLEYTVPGRVARRIWAITMRAGYGANERSQKLKYHIQTSRRSLHAREMAFNDIRTTLQALIAVYDNCNSLHTNAFDEAVTTPTEDSVRRALAIRLIINKEWGLAMNENSNQGSFIIEELTDLVEEAVLQEFERISERGGVLGAMATGYQRGRIQDESLYNENVFAELMDAARYCSLGQLTDAFFATGGQYRRSM